MDFDDWIKIKAQDIFIFFMTDPTIKIFIGCIIATSSYIGFLLDGIQVSHCVFILAGLPLIVYGFYQADEAFAYKRKERYTFTKFLFAIIWGALIIATLVKIFFGG